MFSFDDAQYLFEARHNEMEEFLCKYHELSDNNNTIIGREDFKIIRSNILLMQYNVIESSFLELYKNFYDFLKTCTLSLDSLNRNFTYNIYKLIKRAANNKHENIRIKLIDSTSSLNFSNCAMSICFDLDSEEKKFLVNGNLDGRKIKEFLQDFGIDISPLENLDLKPLKTLKDNRQLLAHGGSSFSDIGLNTSWDTLHTNSQLIKNLFENAKTSLTNFCNELVAQMSPTTSPSVVHPTNHNTTQTVSITQ